MFKLVILATYDPLTQKADQELAVDPGFATLDLALERGARWLQYLPDDIVMVAEAQTSICLHCDVPVEEKIGAVLHRWVHDGGYYACLPDGDTQATPKEVSNA